MNIRHSILTLLRVLLGYLLFIGFVCSAQAQTPGTWPVPQDTGIRHDDQVSARIPIGFPFKFYGQPQTDFVVTTNGLLQFGSPSAAKGDRCENDDTVPAEQVLPLLNTLYVLWGDWRTPPVKPSDYTPVVHATYGVAPNRRHVVQWSQINHSGQEVEAAFQTILHESGAIDVIVNVSDGMFSPDQNIGTRGAGQAAMNAPCWIMGEGGGSVRLKPTINEGNYEFDIIQANYISISDGRLSIVEAPRGWVSAKLGSFYWQQTPIYDQYQLDILDDAGDVVFTHVQSENALELNLIDTLTSGKSYHARVRGLVAGGPAGAWSDNWTFGFDTTPPTAALTQLELRAPDQVSASWEASDDGVLSAAQLTIASDPAFRYVLATSRVTEPGQYLHVHHLPSYFKSYVRLEAWDMAGHYFSSAPVAVDLVPAPEITSPASNASVSTPTVQIQGLAWRNAGVRLVLNGEAVAVATSNEDGVFNFSVDALQPGRNTIYVSQALNGTERRSAEININRSSQNPQVTLSFSDQNLVPDTTITQPGVFVVTAESPFGIASIEGDVNDAHRFRQTYNNTSPVSASFPMDFERLPDGRHTLNTITTDAQGGRTTLSIPFILQLSPPSAPVITSPASDTVLNQSHLRVTGTAAPRSRVQVFVDGQAAGGLVTADVSGNFATSVTLAEGNHQISARASNSRGEGPASATVNVTYTASVPTVVFISPADNATLSADTEVEVSAIDAGGIAKVDFYANDQLVGTRNTTPYRTRWAISNLADGAYTLRAVATNTAGKTAQASRSVTVQKIIPPPPPPPVPYVVRGVSITPEVSFGTTPIQISGEVVTNPGGEPVPTAALRMILRVQGFERRLNLVSDANGRFTYSFVPQANDAGTYEVRIVHPEDAAYAASPAHGSFTINRLTVDHAQYKLNAIRGQASAATLKVKASAGTGATGVHWRVLPADQPSGSLPPGITVDTGSAIDLAAGATAPLSIRLTGSASAGPTGTVILKLFANESGNTPRAELRLDYQLHEARPGLTPEPTALEIGVQQTKTANGKLTITNKGYSAAQNVKVQLRTREGAAPPAWVKLVSSPEIGAIDVGQSTLIQVDASPGTDVADGYYQLQLKISADNDPGGTVPVTVAVARDGQGGVRFKMVDIYTNTLDEQGKLVEGLEGARIRLQNEALTADIHSATSNAQGIAEFSNLPPGNYRWRASAPNHTDASGRITINAGLTANERVFLDYQLVSVEFSVTETTIRDVYNITLEATYQTQVPAPVVLLEPLSINLPAMQQGEELTGELTLSNYGFVRADNVQFALPSSDENFKYEFFGEMPTQLAAKSRVSIPYRITSLKEMKGGVQVNTQPLTLLERLGVVRQPSVLIQHAIRQFLSSGDESAMAEGTNAQTLKEAAKAASCSSYHTQTCVGYEYDCAAGDVRSGSACSSISRITGSSCTVSGHPYGYGGEGFGGGIGGSGWGGGGLGGGSAMPLVPTCMPSCPDCSAGTGSAGD